MDQSIKRLLISIFLILTKAQAQFIISGQVLDKSTKDPLPNTLIKVFVHRDSLIHVAISDELGNFRIPVDYGQYKVTFFFLGYIPETLSLFVDSSIYLGIINLSPKPQQIKEVKIKVKPSQIHIDKKIYIITDSIRKGTAKTSQLLKKLPEVSYNPRSQTISVLGSENVLILVDGIPRDPKSLLNIPSSQIVRIEVITEPTGRYALAEYTAIINIITRQHLRGFEAYTGSFSEFYLITPPNTKTWTNREPYAQLQATLNRTTFFLYSDITKHLDYYSYYNRISTPTDTIVITNDPTPATEVQNFHTLELGIIHESISPFKLGFIASIDLYSELNELILQSTAPIRTAFLKESYKEDDYLFLAFIEGHINHKWQTTIMPEISLAPSSQHLELSSDSLMSSRLLDKSLSLKLTWDNTINTNPHSRINLGTVAYYQKTQGTVYFLDTTPFTSQFSSANIFASYLFSIKKWQVKLSINTGLYKIHRNNWKYELLPDVKIKRYLFDNMISIRAGYRLRRHIPELTSLHSGNFLASDLITYFGNTSLTPYYEHLPYVELTIAEAISLKPYIKISPKAITQYYLFNRTLNTIVAIPINSDNLLTKGISGYITIPISHFLFITVQGDLYKQSLTYKQISQSLFMKHLHGIVYITILNENIYAFLQGIYHDFYNLYVNGFSKDYTSAFLTGVEIAMLNDRLSISLTYNMPIKDEKSKLYSKLLHAKEDNFSIYQNSSTEQFAFNYKYPYFTIDIYFSISKGFIHQVTSPKPSLQDKKETH